jgi:hypothetical protein
MGRRNDTRKLPQATPANATATADVVEQQVVAFAEQLGRVVGTVQAKAQGWLDPAALREQVAQVRDSAASLLAQLGANTEAAREPTMAAADRASSAAAGEGASGATRSRGPVDAPGKKHRKPTPNTPPRAPAADRARIARMKAVNANRKRGRG